MENVIYGKQPERLPDIKSGSQMIVRLFSFAQIGTARGGMHNTSSNRVNLRFETLAYVNEDESTGEETFDYKSACKVFKEGNPAQPYAIGEMLFNDKIIKGIFAKLYGSGFEQDESGGFTAMQIDHVIGACYRVTTGTRQSGKGTYVTLSNMQKRLHVKRADVHIAEAQKVMTLNALHLFHAEYDQAENEFIESAKMLIESEMWRRLSMSHRNMVRKTDEFKSLEGWEKYRMPETRD